MPSSTVTLTSSFFISGRSALRRYPRSSSLISTSGDQSATVRLWISPLPILFGNPAKKRLKRFCVASSISLSGFHVINVFIYIYLSGFSESHLGALRSPLIVRVDPNLVHRNSSGGRQPPGEVAGIRSISEPKVFPIRAAIPNQPENRNKFRGYSNRPEPRSSHQQFYLDAGDL